MINVVLRKWGCAECTDALHRSGRRREIEKSDDRQLARLLRARRERPRDSRAAVRREAAVAAFAKSWRREN